MNRFEAIKTIIDHLYAGEIIIHANGAISRESFHSANRKENFYMLGSMGLASSIALGIAVSHPHKPVMVLDGDGNILMGLGNLAQIGAIKPANFSHFVLDNQVYGTTGNQPTISPHISLYKMAEASGYATAACVDDMSGLKNNLKEIRQLSGPHFLQIIVNQEVKITNGRIPYSAEEIKARFMSTFLG